MNRVAKKSPRALAREQERRLDEAKMDALNAMEELWGAIDRRRVPLKRLVARASRAESAIGKLWSEASWMVERRSDLRKARKGKSAP